jgi:hypothetical protein
MSDAYGGNLVLCGGHTDAPWVISPGLEELIRPWAFHSLHLVSPETWGSGTQSALKTSVRCVLGKSVSGFVRAKVRGP